MGIDTNENHRRRSDFIRDLVRDQPHQRGVVDGLAPPRRIVQYWHNLTQLPDDVEECISSWRNFAAQGFEHLLFDSLEAKSFIEEALGSRYADAFCRCYHPAMQADYFRLCYLHVEGGCYIDADDVCIAEISFLFEDGRLKVQPLCYDNAAERMVPPSEFLSRAPDDSRWTYYFNNNPLVARKEHPIIALALEQATELLSIASVNGFPEIQSTTGPGNLSRAIFELGSVGGEAVLRDLSILRNWDEVATSRWPLGYRGDARNWRLSNQKHFDFSDG